MGEYSSQGIVQIEQSVIDSNITTGFDQNLLYCTPDGVLYYLRRTSGGDINITYAWERIATGTIEFDLEINAKNDATGSNPIKHIFSEGTLSSDLRAIALEEGYNKRELPLEMKYGTSLPGEDDNTHGVYYITDNNIKGVYVDVADSQGNPVRISLLDKSLTTPKVHTSLIADDYGAAGDNLFGHAASLSQAEIGEGQIIESLPLILSPDEDAGVSKLLGSKQGYFAKVDHTHQLPSLQAAYGITTQPEFINKIDENSVHIFDLADAGLAELVPDLDTPESSKRFLSNYLKDVDSLNSSVIYRAPYSTSATQAIATDLDIKNTIYSGTSIMTPTTGDSQNHATFTINDGLSIETNSTTVNGTISANDAIITNGLQAEIGTFSTKLDVSNGENNFLVNDNGVTITNATPLTIGSTFFYSPSGETDKTPHLVLNGTVYYGSDDNSEYQITSAGSLKMNSITTSGLTVSSYITLEDLNLVKSKAVGDDPSAGKILVNSEHYLLDSSILNTNESVVSGSRYTIPSEYTVATSIASAINDLGLGTASKKNVGKGIGDIPYLGATIENVTPGTPLVVDSDTDAITPHESGQSLGTLAFANPRTTKSSDNSSVYSTQYIEDNFVPKTYVTRAYLIPGAAKPCETTYEKPNTQQSVQLQLLSTPIETYSEGIATLDSVNGYGGTLSIYHELQNTIVVNNTDAITINLSYKGTLPHSTYIIYGKLMYNEVVVGEIQEIGAIVTPSSSAVPYSLKADISFNAIQNPLTLTEASELVIEVIFYNQTMETFTTNSGYISGFDILCGTVVNGVARYSLVETNFNSVFLNTNQISDGAITMNKLSTEVAASLNEKIIGPSSAVNNHVPIFNGTSGKNLKDSGILYTDIMTKTTSVFIIKSASTATSSEDRAKLLIDTADNNILKYYNGGWKPIVAAWA